MTIEPIYNYSVNHQIQKLFLHKYERYLPTAFDESKSLLEKMNKLIEAQNQLIDVVNDHREDTRDKLKRGFEIIDGKLVSLDYDSENNRLLWATWQEVVVEPNTDYTLSYYSKQKYSNGVAYTPIMRMISIGVSHNPLQYIATTQTYKNVTNDFKRYSYTFNTGESSVIRIYFTSKSANELVYIYGTKLERGNKSTDWSPAPEDTQSQIDSTNNTLNSYKTTVEANNSFINRIKVRFYPVFLNERLMPL